MSILEQYQNMFKQLPESELQKVGNIFEEILKKNNCVVINRYGHKVEWEMNPDNKDIKTILKKTRGNGSTINSLEDLTPREAKLYKNKKNARSERWIAKAQKRYLVKIVRENK